MPRKSLFLGFVAIVVLAGLGFAGWRYVQARNPQSCKACTRPVHSHMRTVGLVDGKRSVYCCPSCALSVHQQSGKPVQVVELTDYLTNSPLKPESSYLVRNSDVNPCLQHNPAVGESQQPLESHFDRCSPSVLAFSDHRSASTFANEHGGQVVRFSEFASDFQR